MATHAEIYGAVVDFLTKQRETGRCPDGVLGAEIGAYLQTKFDSEYSKADLSPSTSLREFLRAHAEIVEVGRQGADVRYSLRGWPNSAAKLHRPWDVLSDSSSPNALAVSTATGAVKVVPREYSPPATEVVIRPLQRERQIEIARGFVEEHGDSIGDKLREVMALLDHGHNVWWRDFARVLKSIDNVLLRRWNVRRSIRFLEEVRRQLVASGVGNEVAESAIANIRDYATARSAMGSDGSHRDRPPPRFPAARARADLRELVVAAISHMGAAELGCINLPLAAVLAALTELESKSKR